MTSRHHRILGDIMRGPGWSSATGPPLVTRADGLLPARCLARTALPYRIVQCTLVQAHVGLWPECEAVGTWQAQGDGQTRDRYGGRLSMPRPRWVGLGTVVSQLR